MLPLRSLRERDCLALSRNRRAIFSFFDRDHGDGRADCLAWLDELLLAQGVDDAQGEVWLQCAPRVWGYVFNPVSFWYCQRSDGSLRAIVAEVNNTFGERHCYLLDPARYGQELQARKVFHVSPFCAVSGGYRFRFMRSADGERLVARVDHDDAQGPLLQTSVSAHLVPLTVQRRLRALWRQPLMSLGVMLRIHWQALRLWRLGVPFFSKPHPPQTPVSR